MPHATAVMIFMVLSHCFGYGWRKRHHCNGNLPAKARMACQHTFTIPHRELEFTDGTGEIDLANNRGRGSAVRDQRPVDFLWAGTPTSTAPWRNSDNTSSHWTDHRSPSSRRSRFGIHTNWTNAVICVHESAPGMTEMLSPQWAFPLSPFARIPAVLSPTLLNYARN